MKNRKSVVLIASIMCCIITLSFSKPIYSQISFGPYYEGAIDLYKFGKQNSAFYTNFYGIKSIIQIKEKWSLNLGFTHAQQYIMPLSLPITNLSYRALEASQNKFSPQIQYDLFIIRRFSIYGLLGSDMIMNSYQKAHFNIGIKAPHLNDYLYNLSLNAGFSICYNMKKWTFAMEPTYKNNIWSENKQGETNPFHSTIGFGFGVLYSPTR